MSEKLILVSRTKDPARKGVQLQKGENKVWKTCSEKVASYIFKLPYEQLKNAEVTEIKYTDDKKTIIFLKLANGSQPAKQTPPSQQISDGKSSKASPVQVDLREVAMSAAGNAVVALGVQKTLKTPSEVADAVVTIYDKLYAKLTGKIIAEKKSGSMTANFADDELTPDDDILDEELKAEDLEDFEP